MHARSTAPRRSAREIDTARAPMVPLGKERGGTMGDEMGAFRVSVEIENPARPGERRTLEAVLVDPGAELSWLPAPVLESLGIARILLGAHSPEGMNLRVEDRKSTRLNSSHVKISYAVFCLKKKRKQNHN